MKLHPIPLDGTLFILIVSSVGILFILPNFIKAWRMTADEYIQNLQKDSKKWQGWFISRLIWR